MLSEKNLNFLNFIGHHTLLYGETDTGKTYLTAKFIDFLLNSKKVNPDDISILDFAPPLSNINKIKFGGRIKDFSKLSIQCRNILLKGEIIPPRFKAANKKQLYHYLCHNYRISSMGLENFERNPTPYLVINDLSIYLHLGNKRHILQIINDVNTFFGNTYYGAEIKSKFSKILSLKERKRVEFLIMNIENPISTS
jgi:hypothetical protein